jgi:methionine sulfoxide reductase heme-binding subunit
MAKLQPRNNWVFVVTFLTLLALAIAFLLLTGQPAIAFAPMRILAFMAYLLTYISILGVLYNQELVRIFGRMFIKVHHVMTFTALSLMVLHPIFILFGGYPLYYLLPDFTTPLNAFARNGPIALLLFAIAAVAAVLRATVKKSWRTVHWLVYLAFLVASVHAVLLGTNFQLLVPRIVVGLLAGSVIVIYILKRIPKKKHAPVRSSV